MTKKNGKEQKAPEEVTVSWANRDLQKAILYSSVFNVASQLTHTWFVAGKKPESPEEVVDTFVKIYKPLDEWYNGGPIKADLKRMLDTLYPGNLDATCPVELVAHGVPHRVLRVHEETEDD